jgi:AraC-like DNA-binding protein
MPKAMETLEVIQHIEYSQYLVPILYIGLAQSLFAIILVLIKRPKNISNILLSVWLFTIFIKLLLTYLETNVSRLFFNKMGMLIVPMLFGPLLYLYVKSLVSKHYRFRKREWLHFLPFALFAIYALIFSTQKQVYNINFFEKDGFLAERIVFGLSFYLSISIYGILTLIHLHRYRMHVKDLYSFSSEKVTLRWVMFVTILFTVVYILVISAGIFNIFIINREIIEPELFSAFGLTLLSFAVSIYGYRQTGGVIDLQDEWQTAETARSEIKPKYERSSLSDEDIDRYLGQITAYMEKEKPYLDGELTIQDVSDQLGISKHHITQVINTRLIKNFYAFINEYRIGEVKRRLLDPKYRHLKIMSIAYDSGFNSKSSFNTIFKSATGMTPSQYLKKHLRNE